MAHFSQGVVVEVPTTSPNVYAFRIDGHVDSDTMSALAKYMNDVFDSKDEISILFDLSGFEGADTGSILDGDVLKSRVQALSKVDKYAVIGAPEHAELMINAMNKIVPVDAQTFDKFESGAAWSFVGTKPAAR
ncbi:MAG: STAS/SEC14 domain-containing protein [Pseudomonadota bacterium]